MSRYVMALDQGTTSSRAILFDVSGAIAAVEQHEFPQYFPQPGWVEHDAGEIWESQLAAARGALEKAGASAADVAALAITNQRETTVVWDRQTGTPIHRAIVWQSRQTVPICDELRARGLEGEIRDRTGLVLDAYFSATKIRFILNAVEGAQARAARGELCFGTIDSWLVYKLTKGRVHATDFSNASRTMICRPEGTDARSVAPAGRLRNRALWQMAHGRSTRRRRCTVDHRVRLLPNNRTSSRSGPSRPGRTPLAWWRPSPAHAPSGSPRIWCWRVDRATVAGRPWNGSHSLIYGATCTS